MGVSFSGPEVTIQEGSVVDIQLLSAQTVNVDVTVDLVFTDVTGELFTGFLKPWKVINKHTHSHTHTHTHTHIDHYFHISIVCTSV